jgi:hypothetical protein
MAEFACDLSFAIYLAMALNSASTAAFMTPHSPKK